MHRSMFLVDFHYHTNHLLMQMNKNNYKLGDIKNPFIVCKLLAPEELASGIEEKLPSPGTNLSLLIS